MSHPSLHVSPHPLVAHKLAILRDKTTEPKKFRELVRELTWLLGYEAMADLATRERTVETPLEETGGAEVEPRIGLVPVLRAGLGAYGNDRATWGGAVGTAYLRRGDTLRARAYIDSARMVQERLVRDDPRNPDQRAHLAWMLALLGRRPEARAQGEEAFAVASA